MIKEIILTGNSTPTESDHWRNFWHNWFNHWNNWSNCWTNCWRNCFGGSNN